MRIWSSAVRSALSDVFAPGAHFRNAGLGQAPASPSFSKKSFAPPNLPRKREGYPWGEPTMIFFLASKCFFFFFKSTYYEREADFKNMRKLKDIHVFGGFNSVSYDEFEFLLCVRV